MYYSFLNLYDQEFKQFIREFFIKYIFWHKLVKCFFCFFFISISCVNSSLIAIKKELIILESSMQKMHEKLQDKEKLIANSTNEKLESIVNYLKNPIENSNSEMSEKRRKLH